MATFANDTNLQEYEPDILKFGIQDFSDLHSKSYSDIIRLLQIKWFPTTQYGSLDISVVGDPARLSPSRLDSTQFTRAACYHVLAYYIYPRLSTFDPDGDAFQNKMNYYKSRFEEEFELILREGVRYDSDSSGDYSESEQKPYYSGRLIR